MSLRNFADGGPARPWLRATGTDSLTDAWAWARALQDGKLADVKEGLLQTSARLFRDARQLSGELRERHADLAERFYQQAKKLDEVLARVGQPPSPPSMPWRERLPSRLPQAFEVPAFSDNRPSLPGGVPSRPPLPDPQAPGVTPVDLPAGAPKNLDDLAGLADIRQLLRARFIYPLRDPGRALRYRQQAAGGVLLFGPPGTGKTLLTRTLAAELGIPVFSISPSAVLSKWLGDSEKQLAEVFKAARSHPASLIFVDEIDALAPSRDAGGEGHAAMQRLLAQLLTELDGFAGQPGQLLFLGATNRPWDVDAALLRPGRFDALAYVGLPDAETRCILLREQLARVPVVAGLDLAAVAAGLEGYSAAEVVAVAKAASRLAFFDSVEEGADRPVNEEDLASAAAGVHRAATPATQARFRKFAEDHGLPPPFSAPGNEGLRSLPEGGDSTLPLFCQVKARDLKAEVEVQPFISYALQHVGVNPVRRVVIENRGEEESQNLVVEVALVPEDFGMAWTENIAELKPGARWESGNISLPLRLERLRAVQEKELAHIRVTIRDKDEVLFATTRELPVLAYNEWLFLPEFLELAAAFVQSNSPALHPVVEAAAERLHGLAGSRAFSGYQSGDPGYVAKMLQAVHEALGQDGRLDYINPPPSFELTGQKIRLVADTLEQGRGTCLDLAILQAALWEHIGLHPCLVLVPGHALLACWMKPERREHAVVDVGKDHKAARILKAALADGSLQLFNSVEVALGKSLVEAQRNARAIVQAVLESDESVHVVDIAACRVQVTPLP